jgi:membrane fusion protein (multidrug efflux system)
MRVEQNFTSKEAISQEEYDVARSEYASTKAQSQLIKAQIENSSSCSSFQEKSDLDLYLKGLTSLLLCP